MARPSYLRSGRSYASAATSVTIVLPSNVSGDLIVLNVFVSRATSAMGVPSGYTSLLSQVNVTGLGRPGSFRAFAKISGGSESNPVVSNGNASSYWWGEATILSGSTETMGELTVGTSTKAGTPNQDDMDLPSATVNETDSLALRFSAQTDDNVTGEGSASPPTSHTKIINNEDPGGRIGVGYCYANADPSSISQVLWLQAMPGNLATDEAEISCTIVIPPAVTEQFIAVGMVTETDVAQPIAKAKTKGIGQVTEANLAQGITGGKAKVIGQVTETDLAQSVAWAPIHRLVGMVAEVDLAQPVAWAPKARLVGMVTETNLAQPISIPIIVLLGQVTETDLAQSVSWNPMARLINQVAEVDVAQPVSWSPMHRLVGQVVETNLAQPIGRERTYLIALVVETDQAFGVAWAPIHRLISPVSEADLAQPVTVSGPKTIAVGMVTETDLAQIIAYIPKIQQVVEADLAQPVTWAPIRRLVGQVSESDEALRMTVIGGKPMKPWMSLQRRGLRGR
jgi:DNA-binding transcriptional regulator YdaS (Cro superfamily)